MPTAYYYGLAAGAVQLAAVWAVITKLRAQAAPQAAPPAAAVPGAEATTDPQVDEDEAPAKRRKLKLGPFARNLRIQTTRVYGDGSTYTGQMRAGLRDGQGVYISTTNRYEGQWKDDLREGKGELSWRNEGVSRTYEGFFHQDKFHGEGRMVSTRPEGVTVYEGQFVEDARHGLGRLEWPNGAVYDGQWLQDKMWGLGWRILSTGEKRQGEWVDGQHQRWIDEPALDAVGKATAKKLNRKKVDDQVNKAVSTMGKSKPSVGKARKTAAERALTRSRRNLRAYMKLKGIDYF